MRNIAKIAIILIIIGFCAFSFALGVNAFGIRDTLLGLIFGVIGPSAYGIGAGIASGLLATIGLGGVIVVTGIGFMAFGILMHYAWVKADWSLRRWGSQRIAQDLGAATTTQLPSTPITATTRPAAATPTVQPAAAAPTTKPVEPETEDST